MNITRKQLVSIVLIFIALIGAWLAYDLLVFRLKSTSPDVKSVATVSPFVKFSFSQPIKSVKEVSLTSGEVTRELDKSIDGNVVTASFDTSLVEGQKYTLKITGITSKWFNNVIEQTTITFTPTYQDYDSLSEDQKRSLVSQSNSGQIDDPFLNNKFPIAGDGFYVDASRESGTKDILVEVVILSEVFNYDTNSQVFVTNDKAEEYYKKAMELIKKNKGVPEKYLITYSNPYLNQKYSSAKQD
jgi:hypothetical protein